MSGPFRFFAILFVISLGCLAVSAFDDQRPAAVFTVNDSSDTLDMAPGDGICADNLGNCTLRAALAEANLTLARDTINFAPGLSPSITLTRGELAVSNPVIIDGPGARVLTIQRATVPNTAAFRIFNITAQTEMRGLTLKNGFATTGGAIRASSYVTLSDLVITGNRATAGAAIYMAESFPFSVVERCLISNNTAVSQGGAIYVSFDSVLIVRSSTLTGNSAAEAGAIANYGWAIALNNTIIRNSAIKWSDLLSGPGGSVKFELANNMIGLDAGRDTGSVSGRFRSLGGNFIMNPTGSKGWIDTDYLKENDPRLGELSNNGGHTDSFAPLADSPLIDRGIPCVAQSIVCDQLFEYGVRTDQRGYARRAGNGVDIGSIETNSTLVNNLLTESLPKPPFRLR